MKILAMIYDDRLRINESCLSSILPLLLTGINLDVIGSYPCPVFPVRLSREAFAGRVLMLHYSVLPIRISKL
jgi:hypothetical protein